jgi:Palmitoyl protein thioesterase
MKRGLAPRPELGNVRATSLSRLRAAGREALAFARQATLLHRDVTLTYPRLAEPGQDVVVLLHGLFATAGVLRPLRRAIEQEALAHTASLSYAPGRGVASIAETLAELIDRLPSGVRVHLVGHSMGGLVARWYVQELGPDPRVVQTISLAAPFLGTERAWLMPAAAGRDIRPDSAVLARLREAEVSRIPHLSVLAEVDNVVTSEARFHLGESVVIRACGHNGLLYHPETASVVVERVRTARGSERVAGG